MGQGGGEKASATDASRAARSLTTLTINLARHLSEVSSEDGERWAEAGWSVKAAVRAVCLSLENRQD
jgi:hypothetical protein